MRGDQRVDLGQELFAPVGGERDEVAARCGERTQGRRRQAVLPAEGGRLDGAERRLTRVAVGRRRLEHRRGVALRGVQLVAPMQDLAEPAHPVDGVVTGVPDDAEPAAGPQDAGDLRYGAPLEPVPRLPHENAVDRVVGERDLLGGAHVGVDTRQGGLEVAQHRLRRLDGVDGQPAGHEGAGELSCACGQVEHGAGGVRQQPVHCLVGIGRTGGGVDVGALLEGPGTVVVRVRIRHVPEPLTGSSRYA